MPPATLPSLQSYTCRELLCIVFLPCLLISILGIVCSGLAIHHHLAQVSAVKQWNHLTYIRHPAHCLILTETSKPLCLMAGSKRG